MRFRLGFVLAILICCTSFCSKETPPTHTAKTPLVILVGSEPSTLDPQIPFEVDSSYILGNIFDSLVEFDGTFRLKPALAKRWTNPDDKTWRFYLNENAYFSDGNQIKASDVAFSMNRLKTLHNSDLLGFTEHISEIKVLNHQTLDIKTDIPFSILNNLVFIPILSEKHTIAVGDKISETPLGTGPYKLASREKNHKIVLTLNEYYTPKPEVERIEFVISSEVEHVLDDVLRLKPDLTLTLPFRNIEAFQKKNPPGLELLSSNGITVEYLIFNLQPQVQGFEKNPLLDIRLRKALSCTVDRRQIVQTIVKGLGRPATQLIAPEIFGYDPDIKPPECTVDEARRLVTEGGYQGLEIPINTLEGGSYRLENLLFQAWSKVGIKGSLRIWKTVAEMNTALNSGDFLTALGGYVCTSGDASELLSFGLHTRRADSSYGRGNYANYSNPEVDRITEENLRILDAKSRLQMIQQAMKTINADIPYLPLLIYDDVYVVSKKIHWTPPASGEVRVRNIYYR